MPLQKTHLLPSINGGHIIAGIKNFNPNEEYSKKLKKEQKIAKIRAEILANVNAYLNSKEFEDSIEV